ncbi:hypothetical protein KKE03_03435 [Patescibacteria group bacterium]|nr:hypothetical protein [Patescibacteria group bacterium]
MKGLTLIEILVAMGIAAVAGVLLLVIIVNSSSLFTSQSSQVSTGLNINDALMQVRSIIKQSNAVASSYTVDSTTYTSGENQLVLKVPATDSSNNIIADTYDFFIFFLDQSILHLKIFPDTLSSRQASDGVFSTSVDSLIFRYFNSVAPSEEVAPQAATKIRVTLTLKQKTGTTFVTNTATSEANLRND